MVQDNNKCQKNTLLWGLFSIDWRWLGDNIGIRVKWKYKLFPAVKFWTVETLSYEALSSHGLAVLCGLSNKSKDYMHTFAIGRKRKRKILRGLCVKTLTNVLKYPTWPSSKSRSLLLHPRNSGCFAGDFALLGKDCVLPMDRYSGATAGFKWISPQPR